MTMLRQASRLSSQPMPTHAFTISKLATAAGVNIETVRYYQRRGLLDEPARVDGGFRAYTEEHLERLLFIKRAQELGFTLDDAAELTALSSSNDRRQLRAVARARADDIRRRIEHLEAMAAALDALADTCKRTSPGETCPIVAALHRPDVAAAAHCGGPPSAAVSRARRAQQRETSGRLDRRQPSRRAR